MSRTLWSLPGPKRFVSHVLREFQRERHVAIVLPTARMRNAAFVDGLVEALEEEFRRGHRHARHIVLEAGATTGIVEELGSLFTDDPPVAVPDLLALEDSTDEVVIMDTRRLHRAGCQGAAEVLRRMAIESRTLPATDRLTVIAVISPACLPEFKGGATGELTFANLWWWGWLTRSDMAAYLSAVDAEDWRKPVADLLAEVRRETITEVARWDFELAEQLTHSWENSLEGLADQLSSEETAHKIAPEQLTGSCGFEPQTLELRAAWDCGELDAWHGSLSASARGMKPSDDELIRLVWNAQARIILPWIEECRTLLHRCTVDLIGARRMSEHVARNNESYESDGPVEIGQLAHIINVAIGKDDPLLRQTAHRLRRARNKLAHLEPISVSSLAELVRSYDKLRARTSAR